MHIPDGFIAPQVYLPTYGIAIGAWAWALRGIRQRLDEETVPRLAVLTALAYALGLLALPLPGGTSAHGFGVAMLALLFGVRIAFLAYSLVLALQSLLFGAGGITALPINALFIGLVGAGVAVGLQRAVRSWHVEGGVVLGAAVSVLLPALLIALVLGAQPLIAHRADGSPLFFPFGWEIVVPALLIPHLFIAIAEGGFTLLVWRYADRQGWTR